MTPRNLLGAAVGALLLVAACGGDASPADVGVEPIEASVLPGEILGLRVDPEDLTSQLEKAERPYAEAAGLFSLRLPDDELQATLQMTKFDPDADVGDRDVEGSILAQIAKTPPLRLQMGETTVYMSRADRQSVAVWFDDEHFFVLSTRDSYETPRTLLRTLVEMEYSA